MNIFINYILVNSHSRCSGQIWTTFDTVIPNIMDQYIGHFLSHEKVTLGLGINSKLGYELYS